VLSSDQVGVQIQTMDPDTLNFSDSILPEAPQDLHPLQTTQHLEVIHRVTMTDIDFRLEEHFTGNFDPVFWWKELFPASDLPFCSEDGGTASVSCKLVTTQQCFARHHNPSTGSIYHIYLNARRGFFP